MFFLSCLVRPPFELNLPPLGLNLEPLGRILGSTWSLLGSTWALLGSSWVQLGRFGAPLELNFGTLGGFWASVGPTWAPTGVQMASKCPPSGVQVLSKWPPSGLQGQMAPKRPGRAERTGVQSPTLRPGSQGGRPRGSKVHPRHSKSPKRLQVGSNKNQIKI